MKLSGIKLLSLGLCAQQAVAQGTLWYFLTYYPAANEEFLSFSGNMVIPTLPRADTYYLWPGLQPTDNSGVYQNVLDGRSGGWYMGSGWCCSNPSLPWGNGFSVGNGDTVYFSNTKGSSTWTSTTVKQSDGTTATTDFPLNDKVFNQALFAIELHGPSWDFGPLTFNDVVITSSGTDASWCNGSPANYNGATSYTITGVASSVANNVVTCNIQSVVLDHPN